MQDGDGLCRLHVPGLKPAEGRAALHGQRITDEVRRSDIVKTWNTPKGRAIVARWRKITGYTGGVYGTGF